MRIGLASIPYIKREKFFIDLKDTWNNYKLIDKGFGNVFIDKLEENILQKEIDDLYDELCKYNSIKENVVFSTSPIDIIARLIWAVSENYISRDFFNKNLKTLNKMFKHLDCIFYLPVSKFNELNPPDSISAAEFYDENFLDKINQNLNDLYLAYSIRMQNPFFDVEDCPAIIEVYGSDDEKIQMVKMFLDDKGVLKEPQVVLPEAESELIQNLTEQLDKDLEDIQNEKMKKIKEDSNK